MKDRSLSRWNYDDARTHDANVSLAQQLQTPPSILSILLRAQIPPFKIVQCRNQRCDNIFNTKKAHSRHCYLDVIEAKSDPSLPTFFFQGA